MDEYLKEKKKKEREDYKAKVKMFGFLKEMIKTWVDINALRGEEKRRRPTSV